ncbi:AFG1/ZapE family ATPase, partial [Burkholderia pseudomallei]
YHTPLCADADRELRHAFAQLAAVPDESPILHNEKREIKALRRADGVVWYDFATLCGGPRSQNDYIELASRFHAIVLSDVPQMSPRKAS